MRRLGAAVIACVAMSTMIAGPARAGDRGLYLVLVDERGQVADPRRDAFERTFFECGEQPLEGCRAARVPGGEHDGEARPVYAAPSTAIELPLVQAARTSPRGRTELVDALNERGLALDGVLMLREEGGQLSLTLINLNNRTVSRLPLRSDGTIADGHRTRAHRFLARGWVP